MSDSTRQFLARFEATLRDVAVPRWAFAASVAVLASAVIVIWGVR